MRSGPILIGIGGLSGSGKSTLAKGLQANLEGAGSTVLLRSDVVRKSLFGLGPLEKLGPKCYTPDVTKEVFETLVARASAALDSGCDVIVDAVFARPDEREALEILAIERKISFCGLWLDVPAQTMFSRIDKRRNDASDADANVLEMQLTFNLGGHTWSIIDGSGNQQKVLELGLAEIHVISD